MKNFKKQLFLAVSVVVMLTTVAFTTETDRFETAKNLDIFASLYRELNLHYVDNTDPGKLMKTGIDAMLESLDPYTNYYPESEIEDFQMMNTGQYGGIGSTVHKQGDYVIISEIFEGFPAQKAGLRVGDKIVEVAGTSTKGKSSGDLSKILKGEPGSKVKIKIERPGTALPFEIEITREEIQMKSVPYYGMLKNNIGYIKLTSFTDKCGKEVREALEKLQKNGPLKGLIFDLRDNGGGLLRESIDIVNLFVDKGTLVVQTKGRYSNSSESRKTLDAPIAPNLPLTVLINEHSASASEIVSGSLQDLDRAVIVGKKSYGKGLVQGTYKLSYNAMLKVTIAKYYTPSGRCIQAIDYSHKDDKGKAIKIADSLKTYFKTKNGRPVMDGGGILPDINADEAEANPLIATLIGKDLIFDFVTQFRLKHDSIAPAKSFVVTDAMYNEFLEFIKDKDYNYNTESEKLLADFKKISEKEEFYPQLKTEYEALQVKLNAQKKKDLSLYKAQISQLIREEIVSRYYYQNGRIEASLSNDPFIDKAMEVLLSQEKYAAILQPVK
ncbi:MAG: S41 family peptidase [Flavobacteriales bacterium]